MLLTNLINRNKSQRDEIREAAGVDKPVHVIPDAGHLVSQDKMMVGQTADDHNRSR
jgi:hypothetical protein